MKTCKRCFKEKSLGAFYAHPNTTDRLQSNCKACMKEASYNWKKNNPIQTRAQNSLSAWKRYNILNIDGSQFSKVDFDRLYQIQQGKCAMCGTHQTDLSRRLAVDHNHTTGVVRGLLCDKCNNHLGIIENKTFLDRVSAYLKCDAILTK